MRAEKINKIKNKYARQRVYKQLKTGGQYECDIENINF